ncbi:hypothetical protein YC2023_014253 [Brassica napus]
MGTTATNVSEHLIETKRRRFTYTEVVEMTKNFQKALGEGGFGVVYHGYLNDSDQLAVKVLSQSSSQGYKHFKAEVELLLRVHHINLVSLVGYCDERDHLALIYEYMPNGDLKEHLSGERKTGSLCFKMDYQTTNSRGCCARLVAVYYRTGRLTEMSDVYSFGIVLLEIITNLKVIDQNREKPHITEWVACLLNGGDITRIVDPNLQGEYNSLSFSLESS